MNKMQCPKCKTVFKLTAIPATPTEQGVLMALKQVAKRDVYQGQDRKWYFTYSEGLPEIDGLLVAEMAKKGLIVPKFMDHKECYCLPGQEYRPA